MRHLVVTAIALCALTVSAGSQTKSPPGQKTPAGAKKSPPKKLTLSDLPAAVQKTVQDSSMGAEIKNIGRETENGVAQYEIETMLNGKHRDINIDTKGKLLLVEEESNIDAIPAPAKAAIMKKVGDGKLGTVELYKKGGETMYEAGYTTKAGKHHEVLVKADGSPGKE